MKAKDICNISLFVLSFLLMTLSSCDDGDDVILNPPIIVSESYYFIRTFAERTKGMPTALLMKEQGKLNAIKKAYQLTDFSFTPVGIIEINNGFEAYLPSIEYKGMLYSSTKEIGTTVPNNISFYTFATAIRNPRSKLYTEHINESPYHGVNCRAYYGTVCSSLVSYALGISGYGSYDFVDSDQMEDIGYRFPEDVEVADILWMNIHVAIITDLLRSDDGKVKMIEVSEAVHKGSIRTKYDRNHFDRLMNNLFEKVIRYKYLENNTEYNSCPSIVAVVGEIPEKFDLNEYLCVDKGDRSNFLIGEDVTIDIFSPCDSVVISKDFVRYVSIPADEITGDIILSDLPYGAYSAILWQNNRPSPASLWIVVDYHVTFDRESQMISFSSMNSKPIHVKLCNQVGSRGHSAKELFCRDLSESEVSDGQVIIPSNLILDNCRYAQVKFQTDFGIISTWPILTE